MSVIKITSENFNDEVMRSEAPVLLDFWAEWCGPCRMLSPIVDEIAKETSSIKIGKVNVDEEQDLAVEYDVMSIPTLIYIKQGEVIKKLVGVRQKQEILDLIK